MASQLLVGSPADGFLILPELQKEPQRWNENSPHRGAEPQHLYAIDRNFVSERYIYHLAYLLMSEKRRFHVKVRN